MDNQVKSENHVRQLSISLLMQLCVVAISILQGPIRDYHSLNWELCVVVLLGASLLPAIAAVRRAPLAGKACGLLLALLPALVCYGTVESNWGLIKEKLVFFAKGLFAP